MTTFSIEDLLYDLFFAPRKESAIRLLCGKASELGPRGMAAALAKSRLGSAHGRPFACERFFSAFRNELGANDEWRFGPNRVRSLLRLFRRAHDLRSFVGATVMEIGCGPEHPLGCSSVYYLNGASRTVALDVDPLRDPARSSVALFDLLVQCLALPDDWIFTSVGRDAFLNRIRTFDLHKLSQGDMAGGVSGTPCEHRVADLRVIRSELAERVDAILSNATLEHVTPFDEFAQCLFDVLRPGGIAFNNVDFVDHRWYTGEQPHKWAYMTKGGGRDRFNSNQLRCSQMDGELRRIGFEPILIERTQAQVPESVWSGLDERYAALPAEDISTLYAVMAYRKPL
jgi:SAM-dependent methyltransferase